MVEFDIIYNGALFLTKLAVLIDLLYYTPWILKPSRITALTTKYQDRRGNAVFGIVNDQLRLLST